MHGCIHWLGMGRLQIKINSWRTFVVRFLTGDKEGSMAPILTRFPTNNLYARRITLPFHVCDDRYAERKDIWPRNACLNAVMLEENFVPTRNLSSNRTLRVHYVSAFGQDLAFTCSKYSSGQSAQVECTPYVNFGHGGRDVKEAVSECLLRSSSHVPTPAPKTGISVITHLA